MGFLLALSAQRSILLVQGNQAPGRFTLPHIMRAYYFDNLPGDQRLQHDSGTSVDLTDLRKLGLIHWAIPLDSPGGWESEIDRIAEQQGYKNRDSIDVTKEGLGDQYESKIKLFFQEFVCHC
jgi:1,2-dihydroxy-3-keto-5-methylthiopentene dioxygenase